MDYKTAKSTYAQVRKDTNYKLSPDANRREAARRLGVDLDTFTKALTSRKGKVATPPDKGGVIKLADEKWREASGDLLEKLTPDVLDVSDGARIINKFTEGMARYYNFVLRSYKDDADELVKALKRERGDNIIRSSALDDLNVFEDMMEELSEDIVVYRGVHSKFIGGKRAVRASKGNVYQDHGFLSTTVRKNNPVLEQGTGLKAATNPRAFDTIIELRVPKGTRAMYVGKHSAHKFEQEMVLQRGLKYRVVEVIHEPGLRTRLIVEVIPGSGAKRLARSRRRR